MDVPAQAHAGRAERRDEASLPRVGDRDLDVRARQLDGFFRVHRPEHQHLPPQSGGPRLDLPDRQRFAGFDHVEGVAGLPREWKDLGEAVAVRVSLQDAAQAHAGAEHLAEDRRVVRQRAPVDFQPGGFRRKARSHCRRV